MLIQATRQSQFVNFFTSMFLSVLLCSVPEKSQAGAYPVFGPETFTRGTEEYGLTFTESFEIPIHGGSFTLQLMNGLPSDPDLGTEIVSVTSATILLNGKKVINPKDVKKKKTTLISREVTLELVNELSVHIDGEPGSHVTIGIFGSDDTSPVINPIVTPQANSMGWHNTEVTVSFDCSDLASGIVFCPEPVLVDEDGEHMVSGTAIDLAGNQSVATVNLKIDKTAPFVEVSSPSADETVNSSEILITGFIEDELSGLSALVCNGFEADWSGSSFSCELSLPEGENEIIVEVADSAGNYAAVAFDLSIRIPPIISIDSPVHLSTLGSSPITVSGSIDDPEAVLTVNGILAPVGPGNEFSVEGIVLQEGGNTIVATAVDPYDNVGSAHSQVFMDSTAPRIIITYPIDGFTSNTSPITVTGSIYDIVKGEVNQDEATVEVNGIQAVVTNKTFIAEEVFLDEGLNSIVAVGADQVGNTATSGITVTLDLTHASKISLVSGNNQTQEINETLTEPLVVSLTNADGSPNVGETIIFKVFQNNGWLTGSTSERVSGLAEVTDENGQASVQFTLGSTAGAGNNKVEVSAPGHEGRVVFVASGTTGEAWKINIGSGNNQRGAVNSPLPKPLIARVTDSGHNPVEGIPVTFTTLRGNGSLGGNSSAVVLTDSDGRATESFMLGPDPGLDNNRVAADFSGNQNGRAVFTASGLAVGHPGETSIEGVVLDNSNVPIPGVTMRVEGTTRETITDQEGQFLIESVPVGALHLIADGSTATVPGEYPVLAFEIDTVAGQVNSLGMPIYLLPLNTQTALWVGGDEDIVYTLEEVPGFALEIEANSATFPNGAREGWISVTEVHSDKVPMAPPNGLQPRFILTLQPPGVVFDPPAVLTLPNLDGLAPREITQMYSFDHDMGQFIFIGTATVSKDGSTITSDAGFGIVKSGWQCGGNPAPTGGAGTCDECEQCDGEDCVQAPGPCDDKLACTESDQCVAGECKGTEKACQESTECTEYACTEPDGECEEQHKSSGTGCDDGSECTERDKCDGGGDCKGTPNNALCADTPPPAGMDKVCTKPVCKGEDGCERIPDPNAIPPQDDLNTCKKCVDGRIKDTIEEAGEECGELFNKALAVCSGLRNWLLYWVDEVVEGGFVEEWYCSGGRRDDQCAGEGVQFINTTGDVAKDGYNCMCCSGGGTPAGAQGSGDRQCVVGKAEGGRNCLAMCTGCAVDSFPKCEAVKSDPTCGGTYVPK